MLILTAVKYFYFITGLILVGYSVSLLINVFLYFFWPNPQPLRKPDVLIWPHITVELPFYNESLVVDRILNAVINLNYPRDKLQVIILDDSTDDTSEKIDRFVSTLPVNDFDVKVLRRKERGDYKTGALRASMSFVKGDFIAIFDADFIPPSDFLKNLVPFFLLDPKIGFIQARWGFINSEESAFTILQSISLDIHFAIEKVIEQKLGLFINYNGSAGVWRKEAILDCGGWPYSVLSEDLDLSYHAQVRGWKALYLPDIVVPSELISSIYLLGVQQERWAFGGLQVFRRLWRLIISAKIDKGRQFHALSILAGYCIFIMLVTQPIIYVSFRQLLFPIPEWPLLLPVFFLILANTAAALTAIIKTYPDWLHRASYIPAYILIAFGLSIHVGWGAIKGLLGMKHEFVRTPKLGNNPSSKMKSRNLVVGSLGNRISWRKWLGFVLVEMMLSTYMIYGSFFSLKQDLYLSGIVLFLFGAGYLIVAISTVVEILNGTEWL